MEFEVRPTKKIIFEQIIKEKNVEELARKFLSNGHPPTMFWCNGILLTFMPSTLPDSIDEKCWNEQTLVWNFITYADMPVFKDLISHPSNGFKQEVHDVTTNEMFVEVAQYLKNLPNK